MRFGSGFPRQGPIYSLHGRSLSDNQPLLSRSMSFEEKQKIAAPYASETKDARFSGTFEVLVPVPDRNKPHRVASQFPTKQAAEGWLHSDEGKDAIAQVLDEG